MGDWSHVKATATRLPLRRRAIDQALSGARLGLGHATYLVLWRRIWLAIRRENRRDRPARAYDHWQSTVTIRHLPEAFLR